MRLTKTIDFLLELSLNDMLRNLRNNVADQLSINIYQKTVIEIHNQINTGVGQIRSLNAFYETTPASPQTKSIIKEML